MIQLQIFVHAWPVAIRGSLPAGEARLAHGLHGIGRSHAYLAMTLSHDKQYGEAAAEAR